MRNAIDMYKKGISLCFETRELSIKVYLDPFVGVVSLWNEYGCARLLLQVFDSLPALPNNDPRKSEDNFHKVYNDSG